MLTALIIFTITYLFIGLRQIPRLHVDRPAGALVGAVLMVVFGVLTLDQAFAAIDMRTLLLLLGMMIITVYLRHAGFFDVVADKILSHARTPGQLLVFVACSSGLLSALFVNDTICLLYTPIILAVTMQLGVNPMPYLLALATCSNIGSVMTVTGNPQNMLIGVYSRIHYLAFLAALFPVALAGLAVSIAVIWFFYRKDMKTGSFHGRLAARSYEIQKGLLAKALVVCAGVLLAFSLGYPYSLVAITGAVILLVTSRVKTEPILKEVDWTLLLFFSGLFVVMHGVEASGLAEAVINRLGNVASYSHVGRITGLSGVSLVLSNLVSNVPAVMLLKPLTQSLGQGHLFWLTLAMSSTLAGNFTLIGSVANLIVAQQARSRVEISFMEYFRVGALITLITIAVGILVLALEVKVAQGEEHKSVRSVEFGVRSEGIAQPETRNSRYSTFTLIPPSVSERLRTFHVVLLCDTRESRAKGLQGFRPLKPDEAALFVFQIPEVATFWMASVRFPIDIVFVGLDRTVTKVFPDCRPGSREYYASEKPAAWVIETAAGSGIKPGDKIRFEGE